MENLFSKETAFKVQLQLGESVLQPTQSRPREDVCFCVRLLRSWSEIDGASGRDSSSSHFVNAV